MYPVIDELWVIYYDGLEKFSQLDIYLQNYLVNTQYFIQRAEHLFKSLFGSLIFTQN